MNLKPIALLLIAALAPLSSASLIPNIEPAVQALPTADLAVPSTGLPMLDNPFAAQAAAAAVPDSCQKWGYFFGEGGLYCNHAKCNFGNYEHWVGVYMSNLGYVSAVVNCLDSNGNQRDHASCSAAVECFARATRALTVDHQMECAAAGASLFFGLVMNCFNVPACTQCDLTATTTASKVDVSSIDLASLAAPTIENGLCTAAGCITVLPQSEGMLVNQNGAFGYACGEVTCVSIPVLCMRDESGQFDCHLA